MHHTSVSLMIKPVSAACDLACDYCFYRDASLHRETAVYSLMSKAVVDQLIRKSLSSYQSITYIFQGGEPTLAGLPFFQYFVEKVEQERRSDSVVHYALQTNGMHPPISIHHSCRNRGDLPPGIISGLRWILKHCLKIHYIRIVLRS
jgi:sulfatase maturation enzyme AslB (radical SAM superfamily)